jgi:hypothetical protein
MTSKYARLAAVAGIFLVAACQTPAAGTGATDQPVALSSLTATAVPEATPAPGATSPVASLDLGGTSAPPPDIDPCSLITQAEASTMIGKQLGTGVSSTVAQERVCTFKSGLAEVKLFLAPKAPDEATATQYWDAERAQAPAEVKINDLGGFTRAAYGDGTSAGAPVSAMFVIQDTYFFDLYCGFPACGEVAEVAEATTIVGRLPAS